MDSPVPASMFAPEPSSPGAARAAAAAARLHGGFDSDCSEDGEALNGEPELDLTSKVGPGGGGCRGTGRRAPRSPGRRLAPVGGQRGAARGGRARPPAALRGVREPAAPGGPPQGAPIPSRPPGPPSRLPGSRQDHNPWASPRGTGARAAAARSPFPGPAPGCAPHPPRSVPGWGVGPRGAIPGGRGVGASWRDRDVDRGARGMGRSHSSSRERKQKVGAGQTRVRGRAPVILGVGLVPGTEAKNEGAFHLMWAGWAGAGGPPPACRDGDQKVSLLG